MYNSVKDEDTWSKQAKFMIFIRSIYWQISQTNLFQFLVVTADRKMVNENIIIIL